MLPMQELVHELESLGLDAPKTYIQSGNVVFRSRIRNSGSLAPKISAKIQSSHGFSPQVLIISADQLRELIDANPFPTAEADPKTLHLFFLASPAHSPNIELMNAACSPAEQFHLGEKVFYLHAPDGIGRSKLAAKVERLLGVPTTARNWRTVSKLLELASTI